MGVLVWFECGSRRTACTAHDANSPGGPRQPPREAVYNQAARTQGAGGNERMLPPAVTERARAAPFQLSLGRRLAFPTLGGVCVTEPG